MGLHVLKWETFIVSSYTVIGLPVSQKVKNLPSVLESRVPSLCQEDPLEKEMATHSSILAWRIPQTEDPGGATVHEVTRIWV